MSLEFLLGLVVLVAFVFLAVWVYARVFDFVDEWGKKEQDRAMLSEGRLPPMTHHDYDPGWEIGSRYGIDYEPPGGPPDGWERHPPRSKAGRILD